EGLVDDRDLDVLDRHRGLVDAQHAGRLARGRADAAGELREVVRRMQAVDRLVPVLAPREVVPLGDEVPKRAALVAERDAAVHAAGGLTVELGAVLDELVLDLLPVHEADRNGAVRRQLALTDLEESAGVSHRSPPGTRPTRRAR